MLKKFKYKFFLLQCVIIIPVCCQKRPTLPPHLQGILDEYKERYGGNEYNPTYGYEPYWEDGGWVYEEKERDSNETTTSMPQVCGEECNYLYTDIGEVCGRMSSNFRVDGCFPWRLFNIWAIWTCDGTDVDDLNRGFQTFPTYCKFLDAQCRSEFSYRWIFIHSGPCIAQELEFKPMRVADRPLERMVTYFTKLSQVFQNHSLPPLDLS